MIIYINYDMHAICKKLVHEQLDKMDLNYSMISLFEVEIKEPLQENEIKQLNDSLKNCNIEIVESHRDIMVQKIKDTIIEMIFMEEKFPMKTSSYIANKLNRNYTYLASLFSSVYCTSIETFIQLQKTERAKQLLANKELNITEVAWKLNYSSIAHFSMHFKNSTGMTPSAFLRIMNAKRKLVEQKLNQNTNTSS